MSPSTSGPTNTRSGEGVRRLPGGGQPPQLQTQANPGRKQFLHPQIKALALKTQHLVQGLPALGVQLAVQQLLQGKGLLGQLLPLRAVCKGVGD